MMRTRTPVTASCPRCRSSNSVELADLLAQAALTIRCRHCEAEYPIRLRPGLPAARKADVTEPTPPPLTALSWPPEKPQRKDAGVNAPGQPPTPEGWFAGGLKLIRAVAAAVLPWAGKPGKAA
jgi:hypothetical protein